MRLSLTEQQRMLESSVLAFLEKEHGFPARARGGDSANGPQDPAGLPGRHRLWPDFADMGWLGLPLSEADGGFGGGALDNGLLMRAFGRHLVNAPYLSCVLLGARLLAALGNAGQRAHWLPALVDGSRCVALAHAEPACHAPWAPRHTTATAAAGGWRLRGAKLLVAGAPGCDAVLVSASVQAPAGDGPRQAVFLVPAHAAGLRLRPCTLADGTGAADLFLDDAWVDGDAALGGIAQDAAPVLHRIVAEGIVSAGWEACGAMSAALEQTVAYTRQRVQFGKPLAQFQAVQHRLAEMAVCCEEAQAACELAALRIERGGADALAAAAMAKSKTGRAARFVAQESVQLHGAMGVCEELPIASLFRKLTQFQQQDGSAAWHGAFLGRRLLASDAWCHSQTLPAMPPALETLPA